MKVYRISNKSQNLKARLKFNDVKRTEVTLKRFQGLVSQAYHKKKVYTAEKN